MTADTSMLHVRMDSSLKAKATEALEAIGLSTADAVRLLFHRIVADQAFPLELKVPNAETRAAMAETDAIIRSGKPRFKTAEEMFESLEGHLDRRSQPEGHQDRPIEPNKGPEGHRA